MARNEALRASRHYGRAFWKHRTGYHARSRIEANPLMVCKQTIARCLAGGLARRDGGNGCAASRRSGNASSREIPTSRLLKSRSASFAGFLEPMAFACSVMNRFSALGTAEIVRLG